MPGQGGLGPVAPGVAVQVDLPVQLRGRLVPGTGHLAHRHGALEAVQRLGQLGVVLRRRRVGEGDRGDVVALQRLGEPIGGLAGVGAPAEEGAPARRAGRARAAWWSATENAWTDPTRPQPGRQVAVVTGDIGSRRADPGPVRGHDAVARCSLPATLDGEHRHGDRGPAHGRGGSRTDLRDHALLGVRGSDRPVRPGAAGRVRPVGRGTGRRLRPAHDPGVHHARPDRDQRRVLAAGRRRAGRRVAAARPVLGAAGVLRGQPADPQRGAAPAPPRRAAARGQLLEHDGDDGRGDRRAPGRRRTDPDRRLLLALPDRHRDAVRDPACRDRAAAAAGRGRRGRTGPARGGRRPDLPARSSRADDVVRRRPDRDGLRHAAGAVPRDRTRLLRRPEPRAVWPSRCSSPPSRPEP